MRKKRRKAVYVPYDYEAAYMNSLDKMEEANEERILKEGKVKSIYATKEIRSGDQLEVEIYPEFTKGQKDQIPDEGKRKRQRQAQKNLNDKNSKKMCERVIGENFTDRDIWATFTYTDDNMPASMEVATKNMQNYIRRLNYQRKKQGLSNARYVYVTECSEKGRWHHHIVMDGDVDMDTVEAVWNLGKRNEIRRLQRDENGLVGMARYITKEKSKKGKYQKTWCASKGLRKPKEKVNHYKTKQKDVDRIVKGDLNVCDHLMKWYGDKYDFAEAEVKYNTFNGRFYMITELNASFESNLNLKIQEEKLNYQLLQSQINPHFLYNILASVQNLLSLGEISKADKMLADLSRFYRGLLRTSNDLIPIKKELEIACLYMEMEALCKDNLFDWDIELEEGIENFLICKFTLQPILENSIQHGLKGNGIHMHIHISITYDDDMIEIIISDDGMGMSPEKLNEIQESIESKQIHYEKHFGISNINSRICSSLQGHGTLKVESNKDSGTTIHIRIPQLLED